MKRCLILLIIVASLLFGQDVDVAKKQRFASAMDTYDLGDYDMAASLLKTLRSDMRTTPYYPVTLYMQALSNYKNAKYDLAGELFSDFATQYPSHPLTGKAYIYHGNILFKELDYLGAASSYLTAISQGHEREKLIAQQSLDNLAWGYLSIDELSTLLEQAPPSSHLDISLVLVKRLKHAGRDAQALRQGEILERHYPGSPKIKEVKKMNAEIQDRLSSRITVGVILPLSGDPDFVEYGENVLNGIKLGFSEWEKKTGKTVDLLIRDSAAEPLKCVTVAEELIESSQPLCIIGPLLSDEAVALGTLGGAHKIPILTPTATKSDLATISPYFFQVATSPKNATRALMLYSISERADSNFAILAPNDSEGRMLAETAYGVIDARGGKLVSAQYYSSDEVDFSEALTALKEPVLEVLDRYEARADSTDSIFFDHEGNKKQREEWTVRFDGLFIPPSFSQELLNILPQIPFNYIEARIYGTNAWIVEDITDRSISKYSDGSVFVPDQFYIDEEESGWEGFQKKYHTQFGQEPDRLSALGYDTAGLIAKGLSESAITPELMRNYLSTMDEYNGVAQKIIFDGQGANTYARIYKLEKRELVRIK